ncbi:hypothetical protein MKX03_037125 [Papaver bracteatum]|nr:hypothetical protein MKX03_037125 [Papaver bracteatum]
MMGMTQELSTQFKSCRLLLVNKTEGKKRSWRRNFVANQNSVIQLATRQKTERRASDFVPFFTRSRNQIGPFSGSYHFCQSITHRRVCVNNAVRSINHFKVSLGDAISFQNNEVVSAEIRRSFFCSVLNIMGQVQNQPIQLWRRTKVEWLRLLKTKAGSHILMKIFYRDSHSATQEADIEKSKKTGSAAVCLGSHFAEHNKMKSHLYNFSWRVLNLAPKMTVPK